MSPDWHEILADATPGTFLRDGRGRLAFVSGSLHRLLGLPAEDDLTPEQHAARAHFLRAPILAADDRVRRDRRQWSRGGQALDADVLFVPLATAEQPVRTLGLVFAPPLPDAADLPTLAEVDAAADRRLAELRAEQTRRWGGAVMPARGPQMHRVLQQIALAAGSFAPVTLSGEAGTGKEAVARIVHHQGETAHGRFAVLDARSLAPEVQRSELLGTAASGAAAEGLLHATGSGTLLLKEPAELAPDLQREVAKVFARPHHGWRLIVSSRTATADAHAAGTLAGELFHLASALTIGLPPLRQRREELVDHCAWTLDRLRQHRGIDVDRIDGPALDLLQRYPWPGNLRELDQVLTAAARRMAGAVITAADLPARIARSDGALERGTPPARGVDLDATLAGVEERLYRLAMRTCNGNKAAAARWLNVSRPRMHRKWETLEGEDED